MTAGIIKRRVAGNYETVGFYALRVQNLPSAFAYATEPGQLFYVVDADGAGHPAYYWFDGTDLHRMSGLGAATKVVPADAPDAGTDVWVEVGDDPV